MTVAIHRRSFLLAGAAACVEAPAFAQASLNFEAAAAYAAERSGVSLLIMQRGQIIHESYPNEGDPARGWELASGTKSFTGIMAAAAVQDDVLAWDEPAADTLSEWRGDERRRITIRHLLSLTSGIGGGPIARPPTYPDAIAAPAFAPPGERFAYGPTPFQIFGEIMRRKLDGDPLDYLHRRILDPLGIAPTQWRRGRDGNPQLPSGAALTARDWARFGWFVMQDGEGRVDRDAIRACFVPSRANPGYGLSWWLLRDGLIPPGRNAGIEIDTAMSERIGGVSMAAGAGDERLYLIPDLDLVVARQASGVLQALLGRRRGEAWSDAAFLHALLGP